MQTYFLRTLILFILSVTFPLTSVLAEPKLPVRQFTAGIHVIQAEVAATEAQRATGLMHRKEMGQNEGMMFIFDQPLVHCMWMKNTLIPLSVAFIDGEGVILNIEEMQPKSEKNHCAAKPALYALEMNAGWFKHKNIKPGSRIGLMR